MLSQREYVYGAPYTPVRAHTLLEVPLISRASVVQMNLP